MRWCKRATRLLFGAIARRDFRDKKDFRAGNSIRDKSSLIGPQPKQAEPRKGFVLDRSILFGRSWILREVGDGMMRLTLGLGCAWLCVMCGFAKIHED